MARLGLFFDAVETAEVHDVHLRHQLRRDLRNNGSYDAFGFLSDTEFFDTYRLNKSAASDLIHEIEPFLASTRCSSVPVVSKVLAAIAFYANGSYQRGIGQCTQHSIAQQTVSRCIRQVTEALNTAHMRNKYIKFPQTLEERQLIKQGFYDKFHIPGVLGCVDGSHIAIVRPEIHEELYYNRKSYHSLNTQIISDSNLNILSVDASYGGSNHDSYIWERHPIRQHMEQLQQTESIWFLGDSGYSQRKWMMTPILDPLSDSPDEYYSTRQKTARNSVERTIGVLKARWRCLLVHRTLHYDPLTAGKITNACVILHNIANAAGLPVAELTEQEQEEELAMQIHRQYCDLAAGLPRIRTRNRDLAEGRSMRDILVRRLWQHRNY